MSDARWERVVGVTGRALELEGAARAAYLNEACGDDAELRREVEDLLGRGGVDSEFLEPPSLGRAPEAGHRLGEFTLLRELGRGGMGVVYLARQERLAREVAVKVFSVGLATPERQIERFHREARAAASLRHPNIVPVFAEGQEQDTHWFAMEFVEGHDLQRELRLQAVPGLREEDKPFLPRPGEAEHAVRVAALVADVAEALHYAHGKGLVHRDVKPSNLLLQADGRVQIADFGLVRDEALGGLTQTNELAGTPHYMSPEQAKIGQLSVDHRTDVYSAGVVLYELCTLAKPFEGRTSAEVFTRIRDTEARPPRAHNPSLPRDLEIVCLKAMAKDPRERYATAGELAEDLRRFLRHEAILARAPSAWSRARRWLGRRRRPLAAVGLLLGGLLGGAWWVAHQQTLRASARLSLSATAAGATAGGRAVALAIDPSTSQPGPPRELGELPLRDVRLAPGYYRLLLEGEGFGRRAYPVDLAAGAHGLSLELGGWPPDLSNMVLLEGGELATEDGVPTAPLDGTRVRVEPFYLDVTEVSIGDYRAFLRAHPRRGRPPGWERLSPEHDELPVTNVTWHDARDFALWSGKRLPSLAEWLFAARGSAARPVPWADALPAGERLRGNVYGSHPQPQEDRLEHFLASVAPVDSFPEAASPEGVLHLFGNVAEWVESIHWERGADPPYANRRTRGVVGESWTAGTDGYSLKTAYALAVAFESFALPTVGFRCALSALPPER